MVAVTALKASNARSDLASPRDRLGHLDTAYHKSASHSLKHGLAYALNYILEWAAAVCTVIPHLSVQFVQSLADAIEYNWEWAAAVLLRSLIYLYSSYCHKIISRCSLCALEGPL